VREGQSSGSARFDHVCGLDPKGKLTATSTDEVTLATNNHGRIETRRCWAYDAVDRLYKNEQWQDLRSFAVIERERTVGDRTSIERAYYISSLPADAAQIARAVKSHWEVENRLHWCLDVQLNEDQSRVRTGFAANNLAIVRHIVMNLLRLNTTVTAGIKNKRLLASASDSFRAEVLGLMT
jgi:predicted transposase YbfD/YdcC